MQWMAVMFAGLVAGFPALAGAPAADGERVPAIVAVRCSMCHGLHGQSASTQFPKLAGQHPEYIVRQLFGFKTGLRPSFVMQPMTADLKLAEIEEIAEYFSRQPVSAEKSEDPELAAVGRYIYFHGNRWSGVSACVICHGADAAGSAQLPRLAGQNAAYLEARLRSRPPASGPTALDLMHSSITAISELEIKAAAHYLNRLDQPCVFCTP